MNVRWTTNVGISEDLSWRRRVVETTLKPPNTNNSGGSGSCSSGSGGDGW